MTRFFILLLLLTMALPAMAGRLPNYYPSEFNTVGIVNSVDKANSVIVVNGKAFPVSRNSLIHSLREQYTTLDAIQSGTKIAFRLEKIGENQYMLIEIWLLPDDYQLQFGQNKPRQSMATQPA